MQCYIHVYLFKYSIGDLSLVINDDTHIFLKYSSLQQFNTTLFFIFKLHMVLFYDHLMIEPELRLCPTGL